MRKGTVVVLVIGPIIILMRGRFEVDTVFLPPGGRRRRVRREASQSPATTWDTLGTPRSTRAPRNRENHGRNCPCERTRQTAYPEVTNAMDTIKPLFTATRWPRSRRQLHDATDFEGQPERSAPIGIMSK